MVPFVHPSIPDKIRKQLIRDTFAERIKEYCEAKQREKEHLSAITDEMIDEFEKYMEHLHPQEYRRLREAFGRITDVLYERVTAACTNRVAPGAAMTGKGYNGTPVQPQPCLRSE